jgi:hypothetical protein
MRCIEFLICLLAVASGSPGRELAPVPQETPGPPGGAPAVVSPAPPSPSTGTAPVAAPTPAAPLKFDMNRAIAEMVARMLAIPRFEETIEVRDRPQEALEAHMRAANLECGATESGPPSNDEMNRFREARMPPSADFRAAARLLHRKVKGLFSPKKPRYFVYSVQRPATPERVVYVVRDGPVSEDARSSVPGTAWELVASFVDRRSAADAVNRLQRGSVATQNAPQTLWATGCRPARAR